MSARVLMYRLYRLRRLIFTASLGPVLVVLAVAALKGPAALVLLALAVGVPVAHAVRFPNAWQESLTVSLVMTILLALAGTIGPDLTLVGLGLRLLGLAALGATLFVVLSGIVPVALAGGPTRPLVARARRRSRLTPEELKPAITIHPGRVDDKVECGPIESDGTFQVRIKHQMATLEDEREKFDMLFFSQVLESTPESHEVMSVEAGPADPEELKAVCGYEPEDEDEDETPAMVTVSRHTFTPLRRGTRVEVAETGAEVPLGHTWGFWLQDFMADHLTDEIDRAEGRLPRANRFSTQDQLIVVIARRFFSRNKPDDGPGEATRHPAE